MASDRFSFKRTRTAIGAALTAPTIMLTPVNNVDRAHGELPVTIATYATDIPTNPDVLLSGYKWKKKDPADTSPLIITYQFLATDTSKGAKKDAVITKPYTAAQQLAFKQATEEFERFANIKFVEFYQGVKTNAADIDPDKPMLVATTQTKLWGWSRGKIVEAYGTAGYPYQEGQTNNVPHNILPALSKPEMSMPEAAKSLEHHVIRHEIGHNLGLKHPADTLPTNAFTIQQAQDSVETSIMSNSWNVAQSQFGKEKRLVKREEGYFASGLMPLDAAALQKMYGANTHYVMGADTHYFGNANETRTLWNGGKPYTLDARAFNGTNETEIVLDANPGRVSIVGKEVAFNPLDAQVTVLRGSKNGIINFKGSEKGGTRFEGGDGFNLFECSGKGNVVVSPASAKGNYIAAYPGTEVVFEGFDVVKDKIMFPYPKPSTVTAWRDGNDMTVEMRMGRSDSARITLKNFKGKAEDLAVVHVNSADVNTAPLDQFKYKTVTESALPGWLQRTSRRNDTPPTR